MATMAAEIESIPDATADEAFAAFDYTSRYYLDMPGADFLAKVDAGEIRPTDPISGLSRVFDMLELIRR